MFALGGAPPPGEPGLGLPGGTPCELTIGIVGMNTIPPATTAVTTGTAGNKSGAVVVVVVVLVV